MYEILTVVITVLAVMFWFVKDKFVDIKVEKYISALVYIVIFNLFAVICGKSSVGMPDFSNVIFVVDMIIACIVYLVKITYTPIVKEESTKKMICDNLVYPIAQDMVLLGVLIPFLFGIRILYNGFFLSIVYINGGIAIAMLCYGIILWFSKKDIDLLEIICGLLIVFMHAQILIITVSVWLLVVLRIVYFIILKQKIRKNNTN